VPTANCPECESDVFVDADSEQGSIIVCDECHTRLELVGLDPIELDAAGGAEDEVDDNASFHDFDDDAY
jgi:lysine biosynthesis protein LysW